jgi:hypothetical protein
MTLDQFPDPETASLNGRCAYYRHLHQLATELDRLARNAAAMDPKWPALFPCQFAQLVENARRITER